MDLKSMQYYGQGVEDGKRQQQSEKDFSKGAGTLFSLIGSTLFAAFIYSSSLIASYFILKGTTLFIDLQKWEKFIAVLAVAYLISSLVFFLKGIMLVLKAAGKWLWMVIWFICFAFVCLLPAVAVYFLLLNMLGPSITPPSDGISHYKFWSLAGAVVAGGIIYHRYGLSRDSVIKISSWAYQWGKNAAAKWLR